MIVIDALPHRHVSPALTPHLWQQSADGGRVAEVARRIERHQPSVLDWAPMIAGLLDLDGTPA